MQSCIIKIIIHLYGDSYTNKHFYYTSIKLIQLSLNLFFVSLHLVAGRSAPEPK